MTLIAFVGSVFSPYYAWARRRGGGDPLAHCALNVALYGPRGKRWALTERGRSAVSRDAASLGIGPSALDWDGTALTARIAEVTVPVPRRVRGTVRLHPLAPGPPAMSLDADGRHRWRPIAPIARVEVRLTEPALRWSGAGYLDTNGGDEPLEQAFSGWTWSRAPLAGGGAAILYDVERRDGSALSLGLGFDGAGQLERFAAPPVARLPRTRWGIARTTRVDPAGQAAVIRTLEDTPFYARSLLSSHLLGEPITAVHESLSLDRFRTAWVRALLPFRMPRAWR